jgi:hypothetical protein
MERLSLPGLLKDRNLFVKELWLLAGLTLLASVLQWRCLNLASTITWQPLRLHPRFAFGVRL